MDKELNKIYKHRIEQLIKERNKIQSDIDKMHEDYAKDKTKYYPEKLGELMSELEDVKDDISDLQWSLKYGVI